jgi:hypothetical protein
MTEVPLMIEESARAVGAWAWAESSLFEVVGAWVASTDSPSAKIYFDACSQHHGWRAQLWRSLLPPAGAPFYPSEAGLAGPRRASAEGSSSSTGPLSPASTSGDQVVEAPGGWSTATMRALAQLDGGAERLGAYCRVVLPRISVAYRSWQARCVPSSDRPVARVLGFALSDVLGDWEQGAAVLVSHLDSSGGEAAVRGVASASAQVERLMVEQSPIPGSPIARSPLPGSPVPGSP